MSSLIQSFRNWWRGKKDEAADSLADPVRDAKFAIEDSEKLVGGFEGNIADLMAHNKRVSLDSKSAQEEAKKWEGIAKAAASEGNQADCATAVKKKFEATQRGEKLKHEYDVTEQTIAGLRQQLDSAKGKIEHAKSNKEVLTARLEGAKISEQLQKASTAMDAGGPLAALDALERKTVECETHAQAIEELHGNNEESLANKYATVNQDVDDEVAKLMAKAKK